MLWLVEVLVVLVYGILTRARLSPSRIITLQRGRPTRAKSTSTRRIMTRQAPEVESLIRIRMRLYGHSVWLQMLLEEQSWPKPDHGADENDDRGVIAS